MRGSAPYSALVSTKVPVCGTPRKADRRVRQQTHSILFIRRRGIQTSRTSPLGSVQGRSVCAARNNRVSYIVVFGLGAVSLAIHPLTFALLIVLGERMAGVGEQA